MLTGVVEFDVAGPVDFKPTEFMITVKLRSKCSLRDGGSRSRGALSEALDFALEIGVWLVQVKVLNPGVTVAHVVTFRLEFEPARRVGDAFPTVVAAVNPGIWPAPDLIDRLIGEHLLAS